MAKLWWIVHKDLICEFRARRAWPTMLLLGVVVGLVFSVQMELLPQQKQRLVGGLLWLAIFFAGMTAVDRSLAAEREEGGWDGLKLFPLSPAAFYWAKLLVNALALAVLAVPADPAVLPAVRPAAAGPSGRAAADRGPGESGHRRGGHPGQRPGRRASAAAATCWSCWCCRWSFRSCWPPPRPRGCWPRTGSTRRGGGGCSCWASSPSCL